MRVAVYACNRKGERRSRPMYIVEDATSLDDAEHKFDIARSAHPWSFPECDTLEYVDMGKDEFAELMQLV